MERIVALLGDDEMFLENADRSSRTLRPLQSSVLIAGQVVKVKPTAGQMSVDFSIMTRLSVCGVEIRIVGHAFTTFGPHGEVVFMISGAWQLSGKLLTADQGAYWLDGKHTLRLL